MFFWNKVCGFLVAFFIFAATLHAQNSIFSVTFNNHFIVKNKTNLTDSVYLPPSLFSKPINKNRLIPADFSTCNYGFFCKEELKIEKAAKVAIRIRLGSLQQCNYYEGKP
ncbi:MAG TPA: hypothetical protein VLI68_00270 [Hanamia sp.]|jgi:hypothetical protein|nr:hypothetical protein [Hanamia sp.]